jgi:hypothetical protein
MARLRELDSFYEGKTISGEWDGCPSGVRRPKPAGKVRDQLISFTQAVRFDKDFLKRH